MKLLIAVAGISLAFGTTLATAQGRGGGGEAVREACRAEAKMNVRQSRTSRLDADQLRDMRRSYIQDCMKKAR